MRWTASGFLTPHGKATFFTSGSGEQNVHLECENVSKRERPKYGNRPGSRVPKGKARRFAYIRGKPSPVYLLPHKAGRFAYCLFAKASSRLRRSTTKVLLSP